MASTASIYSFKGTLINKTGYLIFEIGRECNLGHLHAKCPNRHPDRYKHVDTSRAMSDDTIVDTAVALIQEHGFRGQVGFHYYNEPTLQQDRMLCLMERIRGREPSARFVLWTNGVNVPVASHTIEECRRLFAQIHLTDYSEHGSIWVCGVIGADENGGSISIHRWPLDDRLTTTGDEPGRVESDSPCCRMFTEMIFDYYGNVHLCCYDWRGLADAGNLHTSSVGVLVAGWQGMRDQMIGEKMTLFLMANRGGGVSVCRTCTAPGRNPHITDFVKAPAEAARAYREEVLSHGN